MNMNRIDGSRGPGKSLPIPEGADARRPAAREKTAKAADQIQFSDQARRLTEGGTADASRAARVEAARRKLASGELDSPEVINRTAEKLLRSGKLDVEA